MDGKEVLAKNKYDEENRKLIVTVNASTASKISVAISKDTVALDNQLEKRCFDFLNQAEIGFVLKDEIYGLITSGKKTTVILSELKAKELDTELYGVLTEILTEATEMFHILKNAENPHFYGFRLHTFRTTDKVVRYGINNQFDFAEHPAVIQRGEKRTINICVAVPDVA